MSLQIFFIDNIMEIINLTFVLLKVVAFFLPLEKFY
jgi:hypothetical protein